MARHLQLVPFAAAAFAAVLAIALLARAGEPCCAHCGCAGGCQKVCRLIKEEKTVSITCWGCKCEDFCLGGPSKPECRHVDQACDVCQQPDKAQGVCSNPKTFVWTEWCPSWAKLHTKTKLMKRIETKKVPSYKWVVENLCSRCQANCPQAEVTADAVIPPPPVLTR